MGSRHQPRRGRQDTEERVRTIGIHLPFFRTPADLPRSQSVPLRLRHRDSALPERAPGRALRDRAGVVPIPFAVAKLADLAVPSTAVEPAGPVAPAHAPATGCAELRQRVPRLQPVCAADGTPATRPAPERLAPLRAAPDVGVARAVKPRPAVEPAGRQPGRRQGQADLVAHRLERRRALPRAREPVRPARPAAHRLIGRRSAPILPATGIVPTHLPHSSSPTIPHLPRILSTYPKNLGRQRSARTPLCLIPSYNQSPVHIVIHFLRRSRVPSEVPLGQIPVVGLVRGPETLDLTSPAATLAERRVRRCS